MRTNRGQAMIVALLAIGVVSGRAVAAEPVATGGAPAAGGEGPGGGQTAAVAQPAPRVAAAPAAAPAAAAPPRWREGFQLVPSIGVHSRQGDTGEGSGPGLRLGLLAGSRIVELLSLNVGFAFDIGNVEGPNASDYVFDIGFNPLFHFPLEKVELVAGPIGGVFVDKGAAGSGAATIDTWAYGWTAGLNGGAMFAVGSKVRLGALANVFLRSPIKNCITAGGSDTCFSDNLPSQKVLALSFAAML